MGVMLFFQKGRGAVYTEHIRIKLEKAMENPDGFLLQAMDEGGIIALPEDQMYLYRYLLSSYIQIGNH